MSVLSVDLGTSNTVAVLAAHGLPPRVVEVDGSATMPSAVYAGEDGELVVGRDAERRARLDPARFEPNPKRRVDEGTLLLGESVVSVTDALGAVLRSVLEETSRQLGGQKPDEVRLTHPAQWGPIRRNVLLSAARLAGMGSNLVLVPEPVAAAAHFAAFPGHSLEPGQALAVYDLGAGTFDCAVVGATQDGFTVLAEGGLPDLGGLDVDQALLEHVGREVAHRDPGHWQRLLRPESTGDRRAQRALREDVRAAKEALSRYPQAEVPMPEPFEDVLVTRGELEALIRPSMLRSVELLNATIASTGIGAGSLVGVYLVGGSSRIPLVATLIAEALRVVPTSLDQPETAVALGAHEVPADGISLRTQDIARPVAAARSLAGNPPSNPTPVVSPPSNPTPVAPPPGANETTVASGFNPIPAYPNTPSGPNPALPPPPTAAFPSYGGLPQQRPKSGNRTKFVLIGVAAAVVVALAVVGGIFWLGGSPTTTTASCAQNSTPDAQGFTPCLRQLAGAIATRGGCKSGINGEGSALAGLGTSVVSCQLGGDNGYTVVYLQSRGNTSASSVMNLLTSSSSSEKVEAEWKGNGLQGRYEAGVDGDVGVLVFSVDNSPMLGVLTKVRLTGGKNLTPDQLADYFEQNVQPGT